jgi:uncharacterized protein (DUF1810 family)
MITDPYNLRRFVDAQSAVYEQAVKELRAGRKESHWMWYVFPQIKGLGSSFTAQKFAISSLGEAKAYLDHSLLGPRLGECTQIVTTVRGVPIEDLFGYPDHLKFHSCMTLFAHASTDNQIFVDALRKYFNSAYDRKTIEQF